MKLLMVILRNAKSALALAAVPIIIGGTGGEVAFSELRIHLSSQVISQGDVGLITVALNEGETPRVRWLDQDVSMVHNDRGNRWYGFLAADLKAKPGHYPLSVVISPCSQEKQVEVKVVQKDRGVRRLTLPKEMVELDAMTLERVKKEAAIMEDVLSAAPTAPVWRGVFLKPVAGEVVGTFGQASVINNAPRSPHSGVDLRAETGTPVVAMNHGRVSLVADQFFTGLSVVIDHGGALQSMYFHLDKVMVRQGELLKKGQVVGLVGSTGRASGPHLHLGVRIHGARVDPLRLMNVSEEMEQP